MTRSLAALILPMVPGCSLDHVADQMRMWNERFRVPKRLRERVEDALLAVRAMVPGPWWIVRRWLDAVLATPSTYSTS